MIDILVPVLGRPHRAAPLVENIRATTATPHTITFLCSYGDTDQLAAVADTGTNWWEVHWDAGRGDFAMKINWALPTTEGEWIFMGADDLTFEPNWDRAALRTAGDRFHVVGTNDKANAQVRRGQFGTHCLIRRRYITDQGGTADNEPGVVLWEGYDHNFVDRELCHVAQHRGVYAHARHSNVRHSHPLWRTAPDDPTYRKALRRFREDQQLFLSRAHLWGYKGLSGQERRLAA